MCIPRVFILETPKAALDFTGAERYGEVEMIFGHRDRRSSVFDVQNFGSDVIAKLEELEFNSKVDSLCVVGSMVSVTLAVAAVLSRWSRINLLLYNAPHSDYVQVSVDHQQWAKDIGDKIDERTDGEIGEGVRRSM